VSYARAEINGDEKMIEVKVFLPKGNPMVQVIGVGGI
jgi:hypothetical protein